MDSVTTVACPGAWRALRVANGADRVALVCVRDSRRYRLQVLLATDAGGGRRTAGTWLPEGRVERQDRAAVVRERCHGLTGDEARYRLGHELSPARALGVWAAGVRVLLASTGVLPAVSGARHVPVRRIVRAQERRGLNDALALAAHATRLELRYDIGALRFFSKWVDPDGGTLKGFFLVHLPERVRLMGFRWQEPERALLRWHERGLFLDFQTFACLRTLTDFSSCDSLLSEYSGH